MTGPLSRYLTDDELRAVLAGCVNGDVEYFRPHPEYPAYVIGSWGTVYSTRRRRFLKPEPHTSRAADYLRVRIANGRRWCQWPS